MNETDNVLNELMDNERKWRRFVMLSAGLSRVWTRGGRDINTYNDLLEDDWDGSQSGLEKLRGSQKTLKTILDCSNVFSNMFTDVISKELVGIAPVLEGVLGLLRKQYEQDFFLVQSVSALVNADAFYLQEMLRDMATDLLLVASKGNFSVNSSVVEISHSDIALLNAEIEPGVYVLVAFTNGVENPLDLSSYLSACDVNMLEGVEDKSKFLAWIGCTALHSGECLVHKNGKEAGVALLMPMAEQGGNDDVRARMVDGHPETILVVDDEDMIWDVVINMLGDLGYTVLLAANGKDAVDIYRANPNEIDLVLMDMLMPVMNGREAFHLLKETDQNVNVLLASGFVDEVDVQDVLSAGARGFMRKPYKLSDLTRKIRDILDRQ